MKDRGLRLFGLRAALTFPRFPLDAIPLTLHVKAEDVRPGSPLKQKKA